MRLSRSAADPLNPGPAGFAHRGLHSGSQLPENSLIAFAAALEVGAGIECDLRLTKDGRIVVFHDADAWRMCASPMKIAESTLAEINRLTVDNQLVPTLESLLTLVAGRVPLLLEVKVENDLWRWLRPLKTALGGYDGPFGIMSFDPRIPRLVRRDMPEIRRGLVIRNDVSPWRRNLAIWLAAPHFLAVDKAALANRWVAAARRAAPVYGWTIRTADERAQAEVHADALIWESDGRPRS
jgi:glycerophosphoryl diester phosphodiesterase